MKNNHTDEIEALDELIREKDQMINETDSKMSMISVYVDQLEERLATFAVARRDITIREEECKEIEKTNIQTSKDYAKMKTKLKEITMSRDEFKGLSDLLTAERTKLLEEKESLVSERDSLLLKEAALGEELNMLQNSFSKLEVEFKGANDSLEKAQAEIIGKEQALNTLNELNEQAKLELDEREESLQKSIAFGDSLKEELTRLEGENEKISAQVVSFEEKIKQIMLESEEKFLNQLIIEAEKMAAEKIKAEKIEIEKRAEEEIAIALAQEEEIEAKRIEAEMERRATEEILVASAHEKELSFTEGCDEVEVEVEIELSDVEMTNPSTEEAEISIGDEYYEENSEDASPSPPNGMNMSVETIDSEAGEEDAIEYHISDNDGEILPPPPPPPPLPDLQLPVKEDNKSVPYDEFSRDIDGNSFDEDESSQTSNEESSTTLDDAEVGKEKNDCFPPPPPPPQTEIEDLGMEKPFDSYELNADDSNFDIDVQDQQQSPETQYEETLSTFDNVDLNEESETYFPPPPPPPQPEDAPGSFQEGNKNYSEDEVHSHMVDNQNLMEKNIDEITKDSPQILDDEVTKDELTIDEEDGHVIGVDADAPDSESPTYNDNPTSMYDETVSFEAIYQKVDDDFEIMSDDDNTPPPGYFEERESDEEIANDVFDKNEEDIDIRNNEKEPSEHFTVSEDSSDENDSDDEPSLPSDYIGDNIQGESEESKATNLSELKKEPEIPSLDKKDSDITQETDSPPTKRKVPFRKLRKTFASLTGVHGLFTPPSKLPKPVMVKKGK